MYDYGGIIELSIRSRRTDLGEYPVIMDSYEQTQDLLALTLLNLAVSFTDRAFNYYKYIARVRPRDLNHHPKGLCI
ncbi:hypothetical protein JCM16161A_01200 [Vulcanisaeta sp. JCM 16161]